MSQETRRRMRGSEAMFLYFERKEMPLHIGCVAVLDGPFDEESVQVLASRLPEIPRYRQRVMFTPLNVAHPSWEDDPAFDIRNHIFRVNIPQPGTDAQLSELAGNIFTPLMDRNKPLWDLTIVDGLEHGRSALILRIHHCMADGMSGVGLVNILFDPTRTPRKVEPTPFAPPPLPEPGELLVEGLAGLWADAAERFVGANITLLRMAQAFTGNNSQDSRRALLATAPDLLRPTERLPFNGACSGVRGYCWTSVPFGEARGIRSALGGTINDVVLTMVTGAFSRYVIAHREPVSNRYVRLMVPVNVRTEDPHRQLGVEISMLPISIPLDVDDPAERLRVVARRSAAMKAARVADMISLIGMWLGWTPPSLQQTLAGMPFLPQPVLIVNTVCTNVPGPMVPLYANGHELLTYYPQVPCGSDIGISIAVSSYNQKLFFGVTYDEQAAPDGELFRDFLVESYEELRSAAGVPGTQTVSPASRAVPDSVPVEAAAAEQPQSVPFMKPASLEPVLVHAAPNGDAVHGAGKPRQKKHQQKKTLKATAAKH